MFSSLRCTSLNFVYPPPPYAFLLLCLFLLSSVLFRHFFPAKLFCSNKYPIFFLCWIGGVLMIYIQTNMQLGGTGPSRPDTLIIMNKYLKEGKAHCRLSSLKGLSGQTMQISSNVGMVLVTMQCTSTVCRPNNSSDGAMFSSLCLTCPATVILLFYFVPAYVVPLVRVSRDMWSHFSCSCCPSVTCDPISSHPFFSSPPVFF